MKMLKIYGLLIGLVAIINMGSYFSESGIALWNVPVKKRAEALVGRWEFSIKEIYAMETIFYEGEIEYFPDSTYKRYVTCKAFYNDWAYEEEDKNSFNDYNIDLVVVGQVSGTWKAGDGEYWEELPGSCNMLVENCSLDCSQKFGIRVRQKPKISCIGFYPNNKYYYGSFEDEFHQTRLKAFTRKKIFIEQTRYHDNSTVTISLKRIKN